MTSSKSESTWFCTMCGLYCENCKKNHLCPRTILSERPKRIFKNVSYYSFADVTKAMMEYAELLYKAAHTEERKVIIEKNNGNTNLL